MKHFRFSTVVISIFFVLLVVLGWGKALGWHRPYVNWLPWDLASYLEKNYRDPRECLDLIWFQIMSPTQAEQRAPCVYEYAKSAKQPTACELLMPSKYGLSCIGEIWGPLIDESNCHWYHNNAVRCFESEVLSPHIYTCNESGNANIDECWHRIAFKKKDTKICDSIKNLTLRSVCKVRIETWTQYPELRSTIYFNDDIK